MIRTLENQDKKLYYVSSSDWECVVLSKDAIEAAGEAFEEAFDTFGQLSGQIWEMPSHVS